MNKAELIESIAQKSDTSKAQAARALDAVIRTIMIAVKKGDVVTLTGFGTFANRKRSARMGRNPRTGAALKIKAARVPTFKAGKAFKEAVNY
jgi:DNA-binding protein HU-beta